MQRISVLAISFLIIFSEGFGQGYGFNPESDIQNISISQWTAEDGLSSNNVTSVFQDSRGLIWITSFNGVMIYDGERIEIYDINNLPILETDGFYSVAEDDQGVVYLGSQGSGLVKYDKGKFSLIDTGSEKFPKSFPALMIDSQGGLYAGSNNQGLFRLTENTATKVSIEGLNQSTITNIKEDGEGKIWVSTEGQGLFCLVDGKLHRQYTTQDGLLDDYVESIAITGDGMLMVATTKGLQYIDSHGNVNSIDGLSNVYINYLLVDEWNSVWAGTEVGLLRWNRNLNKTDWLKSKRGIDLVRISSMIKDRENNLWLSSSRTGLIRLKESMLNNITEPQLSSDRVNIVYESWDENIYVGTDQNGMDVLNGEKSSFINLSTNLSGNGIRDIHHNKDGSFWLATYIGMVHKAGRKEKVYSTANGMPANNFRTVLEDKEGHMWFGTRSGGLVKWKDDQIIEIYDQTNKLEANFVLSVTESENGNLLVGTHSGGLTVLSPDGQSKTYHLKEDDSGILLFNIDMLSTTTALITANIGLVYFDGNGLSQVALESDRRSKTYFDLVDDKVGNIWVTTNLGIMQIRKSDWDQYLDKQIARLPYVLLDENNGMNNKECTGATRSTLSSDGKVLIPTLGGICEVNPKMVLSNSQVPEVRIRNIFVDNQRLDLNQEVTKIEAGALRYVFEFAVLSYTAPERNQFKYQLKGFDKSWSDPAYDGRVEYTNLRPGKYTFKVIGANESNVWNEVGAEFEFRVKPFFYQTPWFYLLVLVGITVIFLLIYRWRISFINRQNIQLKKVNAELDRFVYSASHEIRSPLSSIMGLINLARMGDEDKKLEYFNHIEKSVNRLDEFIQDIVDYSRNARLGVEVEKIDFKLIISNILEDISHTPNFEKIKCDLSYHLNGDFYSDSKRLKIVLSNIITNAFKHHKPDQVKEAFVSISASHKKGGVLIEVVDNGPGIDKSHQHKVFNMFYRATTSTEGSGLGLYIVEETLEKLQGSIEIDSESGKGSAFRIFIKNLVSLAKKSGTQD